MKSMWQLKCGKMTSFVCWLSLKRVLYELLDPAIILNWLCDLSLQMQIKLAEVST